MSQKKLYFEKLLNTSDKGFYYSLFQFGRIGDKLYYENRHFPYHKVYSYYSISDSHEFFGFASETIKYN